jgi:hypothetical protein
MAKRTQLILTHAALFSIGAATAFMSQNRDPATPKTSATAQSESSARHHNDSGNASDPSTPSAYSKSSRSSESKKISLSPAQRFTEIAKLDDPFERQRALMDLVETLGAQEFQNLAEQYRNTEHLRGARNGLDIILNAWAKADPLAALEYVSTQVGSRDATNTVISTWAIRDPAAAEAWALSHHQGDEANPYLPGLIRGIAGKDLESATRLVQTMPRSNERSDAIDTITRALFVQGSDAALAYADGIKDLTLRGSFVASITERLLRKDPTQAAAYVSSQKDGAIQSRATKEVAEALVRIDLTQATAWCKTLQPEAQAQAASAIIPKMAEKDIPGTAVWVSSLAGTPDYDRAVETFIWSCDNRAPEQSAAWIRGISDPKQQLKVYYKMLGDWSKKDAAAVKNWVATNPVPPEVSKRFLTP